MGDEQRVERGAAEDDQDGEGNPNATNAGHAQSIITNASPPVLEPLVGPM